MEQLVVHCPVVPGHKPAWIEGGPQVHLLRLELSNNRANAFHLTELVQVVDLLDGRKLPVNKLTVLVKFVLLLQPCFEVKPVGTINYACLVECMSQITKPLALRNRW